MVQGKGYLFTSDRLGFRNWREDDVQEMMAINSDAEVMACFPSIQDEQQTIAFVQRMQNQFHEKGYCYYAVDRLDRNAFIGFIGLSWQTYQADFTPCVDIGWRLKKAEWNQGFATEGARRCLAYAFNDLGLDVVYAVAPKINDKSIHIIQSIGMKLISDFDHPFLLNDRWLKTCVVYSVEASEKINS